MGHYFSTYFAMAITIQNIQVLNNPAKFTTPFKFQITFDCVSPGIEEELEWKLVYVGSADNESNDQELDSILVGPVRVGKNRFSFEAPCPDPSKIPSSDLLDVTVILLTCSYKEREFIRIGYYVHNEYEEELDQNNENMVVEPNKIIRNILADKPRVTRFNIVWDDDKENDLNQNEENKQNENDEQYEDEEEEEEEEEDEDDDDEEEEDEDDDDDEEDLADTESKDNNHRNKSNQDEDQDIDMTE